VPAGSSLRCATEIDSAGVRIAALRGHASTAALLQIVRRASPLHVDPYEQALDLLRTGSAAAFASIRQILVQCAARLRAHAYSTTPMRSASPPSRLKKDIRASCLLQRSHRRPEADGVAPLHYQRSRPSRCRGRDAGVATAQIIRR